MSQQVEAILEQIERLDEADRLVLEQRLGELAEVEWKREAENAVRSPVSEASISDRLTMRSKSCAMAREGVF